MLYLASPSLACSSCQSRHLASPVHFSAPLQFFVPRNLVPSITRIVKQYVPMRRRGVIHSVYCDDPASTVYNNRLVRLNGARLLRYRWYGDDVPGDKVYVETKTHRNEEASQKERFA